MAQVCKSIDIEQVASDVGSSAEGANFDTIFLTIRPQFVLKIIVVEVTILGHRDQFDTGTSLSPRQQVRVMLKDGEENNG